KGYGFIWTFAMSAFIYAGSMQYVAVDLITCGASLITAALTTLMVNARHLFYCISMEDNYRDAGKMKPYMIFALTDETYSLVCGDVPVDEKDRHSYCLMLSVFNQCYWVGGSVLGALLGSVIPFSTEGIDFALTALFVTVFVEQWLSTKDHASAIIGVVCSAICLAIFGSGSFLIPAMIAITVSLTILKKLRRE
ncbi:MAG: AzlC family ABC transporter permease, partial [Clostridia bacterium]|nr:AzlC family ABC transporter permease [Clostridia bacterium]